MNRNKMTNIVPFPNAVWTEGMVLQDLLYGRRDCSNPMYCLWKLMLEGGEPVCRAWRRSYPKCAADMLNQVDDLHGDSDFMRLPAIMQVELEIRSLQKPARGRKRAEGFANRAPSFSKPNPDGSHTIGGRRFANKYNYEKYRKHVNYVGPNGERLIEGIDFHLDADGVVRKGPATYY
jgi:hypothetical protein